MASGVNAGVSATRPRTNAVLAGSPTNGPSGVRLPIASPQMTAAKASLRRSWCGGSRQSRHAAARSRKRSPPRATIAARPQPTCRTSAAISETPTRRTTQTSSVRPPAAVRTPVTLSVPLGPVAGGWDMEQGFHDYNRRLMLPASFQLPAAIILLVGGPISFFAGYRVFRVVLGIYGGLLGALLASGAVGTEHTAWMLGAAVVGGVVGALILIA